MDWCLEVEAEEDIDEYIRTISCKGDCSGNLEVPEKASALKVGRGKNDKDSRNRIIPRKGGVQFRKTYLDLSSLVGRGG